MSSVDHQPEASQVKPFIVGKVTSMIQRTSGEPWGLERGRHGPPTWRWACCRCDGCSAGVNSCGCCVPAVDPHAGARPQRLAFGSMRKCVHCMDLCQFADVHAGVHRERTAQGGVREVCGSAWAYTATPPDALPHRAARTASAPLPVDLALGIYSCILFSLSPPQRALVLLGRTYGNVGIGASSYIYTLIQTWRHGTEPIALVCSL